MQNLGLMVMMIVSFYALSTVACWLIMMRRTHGIVYAPVRLFRQYKPIIRAFAFGFFPAALIIAFIAPDSPEKLSSAFLIFSAGLLISGLLVHKDLRRKAPRTRAYEIVIIAATGVGLALSLLYFFVLRT